MEEKLWMESELEGKIDKVIANLTVKTYPVIEELLRLLPGVKFYLSYGYTKTKLKNMIDKQIEEAKENHKLIKNIYEFMKFGENSIEKYQFFSLRNSEAKAIIEDLKDEKLKRFYEFYERNEDFRNFVNYFLVFLDQKFDVTSIKKKAPDRIKLIPIDTLILSHFSRDRLLITERNNKPILIQGKICEEESEGPNLLEEARNGDLKVVYSDFWKKNGFDIIYNSEVELEFYEGGDIRVTDEKIFLGPSIAFWNLQSKYSIKHIANEFKRLSGKENVIFTGANPLPDFHLDMYLTPLDENTIAIGDIEYCINILKRNNEEMIDDALIRGYKITQKYLDKISVEAIKNGLNVERIPLYYWRGFEGLFIRSYANDIRNGNDIIVAEFGVKELDDISSEVFEEYGYKVKRMKSLGNVKNFGKYPMMDSGIRCMANVIKK